MPGLAQFSGCALRLQSYDVATHTATLILLDAVPNITPERSTLGGFSNGANTTGVLLAGQDDFILRHFRAFFQRDSIERMPIS